MPRGTVFIQALCAGRAGFSLHAAVRCEAEDRRRLEQLCRYITRPALANKRVRCNKAGLVVLKLNTPWRDGTTHIVMSPPEFVLRKMGALGCPLRCCETQGSAGWLGSLWKALHSDPSATVMKSGEAP